MSENMDKTEDNVKNSDKNGLNEDKSDYESCDDVCDDGCDQYMDCKTFGSVLSEEEFNECKDKSIELKSEGNQYFRDGLYDNSIQLYTKALDVCPHQLAADRSVLYSNRSAAQIHCNRLDEALNDSNLAIDLNPNYVKAVLRRAQIYRQMTDKLDDCLKDYERVLELNPNSTEALVATNELKVEINERNERLKQEMMSKLKDLGNLVLRPFGLSTDNFKMNQNPETGGYSVNFQNN